MVELRYGSQYEVADLAGRNLAEVRQWYVRVLDIPESAIIKLNGKAVQRKDEPDITLKDSDELRFVKKSRRLPIFIMAILLALGATAVPFAFAQTTATISANVTAKNDFVTVEVASPAPTWNVWGTYKASTGSGELFKVTPGTDFTGDLVCSVIMANVDELIETYRMLVMTISIYEDDGSGSNADTGAQIGSTEYLTLSKGEIDILMEDLSGKKSPFWVYLDGGYYIAHRWGGWSPSGKEDPLLYCDITQKGL